jgi:hypothetical protein
MLKFSFFISLLFLFLLAYQSQVNASRVDASKFGFNTTDASTALKTAMAQPADTVIVPNMGSDWIVTPIFLTASNKTIIFEKGVVVTAKKGEFHGSEDCLFKTKNVTNVSLIGYGATFRMQKADYMTTAYGFDPNNINSPQARHCIAVYEANGVKIQGLTLKESGGDGIGIYYGASNVLVKDVICDNIYRQGMSPCDVTNLTIENCVLINTKGAPDGPWAGIDFEPWYPYMKLVNIKMTNCYTGNNNGGGIIFSGSLDNTSAPVTMELRHNFISEKNASGIRFYRVVDGLRGSVSFDDCIVESGSSGGGLNVLSKASGSYQAKFTSCLWQFCNPAIKLYGGYATPLMGNLNFVNSTINEPDFQFTFHRDFSGGVFGIKDVTGNIKINSPFGIQTASIGSGTNVTLKATEQKSKPPIVESVKPDKGEPVKVTDYSAGSAINVSAAAYDPDIGKTDGDGMKQVDFALWRGNGTVANFSDMSAPFAWPVTSTITAKCGGIYLIRITAYSNDGSFTVAVVPINIYNPAGPGADGTGVPVPPIIIPPLIQDRYETFNMTSEKDFLVRNTLKGFLVYSPFATDSRIVISDLSGRQVTLAQTAKGKSWNNIVTHKKLSNSVYFIRTIDEKGNNSIGKKAMIAK